jgi:hypothetical protein
VQDRQGDTQITDVLADHGVLMQLYAELIGAEYGRYASPQKKAPPGTLNHGTAALHQHVRGGITVVVACSNH